MQAFGLHHPVAMQLFQILIHLDIQQPNPGQGNPEAVFWKLYEAFQDANADPAYDMVAWAQSYYTHQINHPQEQHPPVVVELSYQILQWTHQWPDVQNQAMQHAQPAFDQQAPPAQDQAHAMQLAQPAFNQQGHNIQQQAQAIQPVQPAFNQQGFVVQQQGQAIQPVLPDFNQQGYVVQQQGHLMQPAQHMLHQQGPVEAQHEGLAIRLALPALHQPNGAADHGGPADHGDPAHHGMVDDVAPYAAADHAAQAGVEDGAADYGARSSASHGAFQEAGDDAAGGMPHNSSTDAMDEDKELEHLHSSDLDIDLDTVMESLDSSQRAELLSQTTDTDGEDTRIALLHLISSPSLLKFATEGMRNAAGVDQQLLPTADHHHAHSQPGSSAHSDGHGIASVPRGDPVILEIHRSLQEESQEDMEQALQASIQSAGASPSMQASTSSQLGMLNASHSPSPSRDRSSPSTQESVYNLPVPPEQDFGQALISCNDLVGDWQMSNEVQPVARPAVSEADLRRALVEVSARINTQASISPEQARLIKQVGQLLHPLANRHCKGTHFFRSLKFSLISKCGLNELAFVLVQTWLVDQKRIVNACLHAQPSA